MGASIGVQGQVASWGGSFNTSLLALIRPASFTLNQSAQEFDTTGYNSSNLAIPSSYIHGLRQWGGSIEGFNATPVAGVVGSVSGTSYATAVRAWGMDIECDAKDVTTWSVTNYWRAFKPGLQRVSGFYEALVDDATVTHPVLGNNSGAPNEPQTGTFTISSGNTWAGSLFTTSANIVSRVGDMNVVRYNFRVSGQLAVNGSAAFLPDNDTGSPAMVAMAAGELVLEADDGVTFTGNAFPTRMSINVRTDDVTRVAVQFQGTGAMAHAAS